MQTATSESLYRRLQEHLDRMPVGFPATQSGVEIRILERLFTPEEAGIALELSAIPEPAVVIHKRFKSRMTLPELKQKLQTALPAILGDISGEVMKVSVQEGTRIGGEIGREHPEWVPSRGGNFAQ